jgi:hypothetical protein
MPRCSVCSGKKIVMFNCSYGLFHTHISVLDMFITEESSVTVKCRTAIKILFLYLNLCLSVKLGRLLCSLASIWLSISFLLLMCHEQNKTHTQQNQTSNKLIYNSYNTNGPSWPWSYGSWIHSYLCNQCLSPLMLWVRISIRARCTTLCDKVC